jgi:PAS domain S-box-containing protein
LLAKNARPTLDIRSLVSHEFSSIRMSELSMSNLTKVMDDKLADFVLVDEAGKHRALVSSRDTLRLIERQLGTLKKNYEIVLNSTYDGIVAIDEDGKVTVFNEAAGRILGHPPEKIIGKPIIEFIPNTRLLEILSSKKAELRQKHRIGKMTLLVNRTPILSNNKVIGAMAVFQDISAEEELLSELIDIKQFVNVMELILDNAYVGIIFCDSSGIIRFINRIYEELIGIDRNIVIGKHITDYFPDSRVPVVIKTGKAEIGWKYNFRGEKTLVVNRIPIKKGGQVIGAIAQCIFKDISELKELMNKLDLLETKVKLYRKELTNLLAARYRFEDILGDSEYMVNLKKLGQLYARTDSPVLIIGDTGTGKELLAHAIHNSSSRERGPFVCLNCASIPGELVESELFGYAPGAFTGAHHKGKTGKFELADGGTLFLDEIGDLPLPVQAKLLRVIEEKRVEKIGDVCPIEVDFRLVTATHRDLEVLIGEGRFREDLYYRLGTMTLFVPSLRNRQEDIPALVDHFIQELGEKPVGISDQALQSLMEYSWPGNVRELRNVVERALSLVDDEKVILRHHLPPQIFKRSSARSSGRKWDSMTLKEVVRKHEEKEIREVLVLCNDNKVRAANLLGISRSMLYNKLKRYGIR